MTEILLDKETKDLILNLTNQINNIKYQIDLILVTYVRAKNQSGNYTLTQDCNKLIKEV